MQFEVTHELDVPLVAVARAVLSPELLPLLARAHASALESIEVTRHEVVNGELRRVARYCGRAPPAILRRYPAARDATCLQEEFAYRAADCAATWVLHTNAEWARFFHARGSYTLSATPSGGTRRVVAGELAIEVSRWRRLFERMAIAALRRMYGAEARVLSELARA